jgi:hypothetical protein
LAATNAESRLAADLKEENGGLHQPASKRKARSVPMAATTVMAQAMPTRIAICVSVKSILFGWTDIFGQPPDGFGLHRISDDFRLNEMALGALK